VSDFSNLQGIKMHKLGKLTSALILFVMLFGVTSAQAQSYYRKETSLYIELFGTGGELSANFEKIVGSHFTFRTGIGFTGVAYRKGYVIPFGVSLLIGGGENLLELGVGGTWIDFDDNGDEDVIFDLTEDQLIGHAIVGYRFIGDYGFTYRLAFTPGLTKEGIQPMGGAAFGYSF